MRGNREVRESSSFANAIQAVGDVGGAINVGLTLTRSVLTGAVGSTGPPGPAGATGPPGPAGALNVQYRSVQAVRRRPQRRPHDAPAERAPHLPARDGRLLHGPIEGGLMASALIALRLRTLAHPTWQSRESGIRYGTREGTEMPTA